MNKIEPIGIGGLHRGLFIPEIYIENTKLHNEVNGLRKQRRKVREKNKKLQSNWNELEEWVKSEYNRYYNDTENLVLSNVETMDYSRMLDKMKEIKGGNKE